MKLLFTNGAVPHELPFPESDDLTVLGECLYRSVIETFKSDDCRKDLHSRIFDGLLNSLVDQTDLNLGEVNRHSGRDQNHDCDRRP